MRIDNRLLQYEEIAKSSVAKTAAATPPTQANENGETSFAAVFRQTMAGTEALVFSKHAEQRLQQRNISLSAEELQHLNEAAKKAEEKGIHNSLILMADRAFIVNIPSSTVITAMDGSDMQEHVFTKIDGAVII